MAIRDDAPVRSRRPRAIAASALAVGCLAVAAASCSSGAERNERPSNPVTAVRDAAVRTLAAGPARMGIAVSSATTRYAVRGSIDLASDSFRARAHVKRAPMTHHDDDVEVIGVGGETYEIGSGKPGFDNLELTACGFDPHAAIGSLGGGASIQEAVALAGIAVRLLRDGTRTAEPVAQEANGATYRVVVDPDAVSVAPAVRRGDEVMVVDPPRLARHLAPLRVKVDSGGLVRGLSLELRRFAPPSHGPGLARERRREQVSITLSLSDFGRDLDVRPPACVAME